MRKETTIETKLAAGIVRTYRQAVHNYSITLHQQVHSIGRELGYADSWVVPHFPEHQMVKLFVEGRYGPEALVPVIRKQLRESAKYSGMLSQISEEVDLISQDGTSIVGYDKLAACLRMFSSVTDEKLIAALSIPKTMEILASLVERYEVVTEKFLKGEEVLPIKQKAIQGA